MNKELIITNTNDLVKLNGIGRKYRSIRLDIPSFTKERNEEWASLIQKEYKACGCSTGSYFIMSAILFAFVFFLFNISTVVNNIRYYLVLLLILVIGMGVFGKLAGLISANRKLNILIDNLKGQLPARQL
jgi:hypothetical protein